MNDERVPMIYIQPIIIFEHCPIRDAYEKELGITINLWTKPKPSKWDSIKKKKPSA